VKPDLRLVTAKSFNQEQLTVRKICHSVCLFAPEWNIFVLAILELSEECSLKKY